jgi:hypothetical protein
MEIGDISQARSDRDRSAESGLDEQPELWAPSLAPRTPAAGDSFLRQEAFGNEPDFQPTVQTDLPETDPSFGSHRKLIAGIAIVAALSVAALAYFSFGSAGEKTMTKTAESAPTVQSLPEAPVQTARPKMPEPSPVPPVAVAWPDLPPSLSVEASSEATAAAPTENSATDHQTVSAPQDRAILFLQRPGVNIRSTPSATGSVLGTAPKGKSFTVTSRDGDWVQVESGRLKGWIKSQFLAPNRPQ